MGTKSSTRKKRISVYKKFLQQEFNNSPVGPIMSLDFSSDMTLNRTRTGSPNPKWRSQIFRGENATTPFSASETIATYSSMDFDISYSNPSQSFPYLIRQWGETGPGTGVGELTGYPSFLDDGANSKADNEARQKFYKRAANSQRYLQAGVFLGELKQTLRLIRNPALAARKVLEKLVRAAELYPRRFKTSGTSTTLHRISELRKLLADSWLEFSFGWKPLASDVNAGFQLLSDFSKRMNYEFVHIVGVGEETVNTLVDVTHVTPSVHKPFSVLQTRQQSSHVLIKYYGRIKLDVPDIADGWLQSGLGLTKFDIVPTAWELIPWSFFVDYFTNIGDVIQAYSYPKAKIAWVSKVIVRERGRETHWSYDPVSSKTQIGSSLKSISVSPSSVFVSKERTVIRTTRTNVLPPDVAIELPGFGQKFNIAALLLAASRGVR